MCDGESAEEIDGDSDVESDVESDGKKSRIGSSSSV